MKKLIYILCASFMMLFSSCCCEDEITDIYDIYDHLEQLEGSKIPMLEQQIESIKASLSELNAVDEALRQLISELSNKQEELQNQINNNAAADAAEKAKLEKELKDLKALIASLQSKDEELTQQIEELQNYVNNEISGLQNWAEGTFATLEQYAQMQTELAAIKALIDSYGGNMGQLTQAISEAIETSEASMKTWVNNLLAEGYYDIVEIDGKLAALLAMIEEGDAELKKDIEDQKAALEVAKAELTEAYKKAIEEAINNNNGAINKAIANAVQKALDKVETKLAVIENAIAAIQKDIENIKSSIASLEQQIESINASLTELNAVDEALRQLISELSNKQEELQNQINNNAAADAAEKAKLEKELKDLKALIASLQSKDEELTQQIEELQNYVNNEISGLQNWAEGTFATLEQYAQMQTELAAIKALIDSYGGNMGQLTQAISEAIETSETSMKTWVNNLLAEGYYDIAEIDGKLAALLAMIEEGDAELKKDIEDQNAALELAKAELTEAYKKAIEEAINNNNGAINKAIANAVQKALDKVETKLAVIENAIAAIQKDIENIKSSIASLEQQIESINASLTELNAVDEALRQLISELSNKQEELQNQIDNNAAADAAEKAKLEKELKDLKALIASLQSKDEELTQQIEELQNYVNNEISGLQNWAEGTFATLEQYVQMQTELAAIKALIDSYGDNMGQLTQAISEAIETSEASMKTWVNNMLAEGYYDIVEIDGKLAALLAMIEEGDAELKKDIEDQKAALELAKAELTEAYKKAIEEAINNNNGAINKAIADAVQKALDKVETKLAVIENAIAAIQKDIENIKSSIASLEQQIESINASLTELNAVDEALRQLISELSNKQEELQNQIDNNAAADAAEKAKLEKELKDLKALIASLQSKDEELTQQIEELQNYVNNEISGLQNWAEGTFATLEQYAQMQTELAAIKGLIGDTGGDIEQFTQAISGAIEASETSMKAWVNSILAEGYYDIAEIDAKLDALRSELTSADTEILKNLAAQQAALEQAKKQLADAYEKAIAKAIEENNGVIDAKIESAVEAATSALQDQINAISSAIANMQAQLDMIASRIQSVTYIPQYSDGKIKFSYTEKTTEVYLRISPAVLASKIETSMVKAFARYTDDPITRSLNDELPISVSLAAGDGTTGILHVCLAEDTANKLSDAFWSGDAEAIIYIQISDGNSNIVSPYIPVVAHGYVSNSADIGGFDDGSDTTGTVM